MVSRAETFGRAAPVVENKVTGLWSGEVVQQRASERDDDVLDPPQVRGDQEIVQTLEAAADLRVGGVLDLTRQRHRAGGEPHDPFKDTRRERGTGLRLRPTETHDR